MAAPYAAAASSSSYFSPSDLRSCVPPSFSSAGCAAGGVDTVARRLVPPGPPVLAKGRLLVASRRLGDPNFQRTVVLLLEYGRGGALGVIVNRPGEIQLRRLLPEIGELADRSDRVFLGGPVARQQLLLLVRASSPPPGAFRVDGETYATGSLEALREAAGRGGGQSTFRVFAGYAGWAGGQLEAEIERGDWRVRSHDADMVFSADPADVWRRAIEADEGRWVHRRPPALVPLRHGPLAAAWPASIWLRRVTGSEPAVRNTVPWAG